MVPELSSLIVVSHEPTLSLYDFQNICSVMCTYRFFEIICASDVAVWHDGDTEVRRQEQALKS